jgi:hypothetical protein
VCKVDGSIKNVFIREQRAGLKVQRAKQKAQSWNPLRG